MYKRQNAVSSAIDLNQERTKYDAYKQELLNNDFSQLNKWMEGKSIDAFTSGSVPSKHGAFKQIAINALKDIGYSAIGIRVQRVETDSFWVLSGTDLHFFTTNLEGALDKHLQFDNFRIEEAKLKRVKTTRGKRKTYVKTTADNEFKMHTITFNVDGTTMILEIHDRLNYDISGLQPLNVKKEFLKLTKYQVVGEKFIEIIQKKFPELKLI